MTELKDDGVLLRSSAGVAEITLNRPTRMNSFTPASYAALAAAVVRASEDDAIDLITITGAGDAFCTGGDLQMLDDVFFPGGRDDPQHEKCIDIETTRNFIESADRAFTALETSPKIVIAAINGTCQAGGLGVALCADLVIAVDTATFRVPEGLVGLADPFIPVRLARRVGTGRARLMMFTGEYVDALTAHEIGLVDKLVSSSELRSAIHAMIEQLSKTSPTSRRLYKRALNGELPQFDLSIPYMANTGRDAKEGVGAFVAKRSPEWRHRTMPSGVEDRAVAGKDGTDEARE